MIEQTEIPGLGANERGYTTGNEDWPLARVRLTPVQADPAISASVNGPVATSQIVMQVSVSLVDDEGQVLTVGGRLLVRDASRHSWMPGGATPFNPTEWLDGIIAGEIERIVAVASDLSAADGAGLLAPPQV